MSKTKRLRAAALLLAAGTIAACGDDGTADDHAGHGDHDSGLEPVPCPESIPAFVATESDGLEVTGEEGRVLAKLIDADWKPPQALHSRNDWTVVFTDLDGEPLEDLEVTEAQTFMRVHNHPGRWPPKIEPLDEPGTVFFRDFVMHMGGPWEVFAKVRSERAGGDDKVVFHVCVID